MTARHDAQHNRRLREALANPRLLPRRKFQRDQLLADGLKALALIEAGRSIGEVLWTIPGSRARLYRAIEAAQRENTDSDAQALLSELEARAQFETEEPIDALLL
jgi:hypothetical protein